MDTLLRYQRLVPRCVGIVLTQVWLGAIAQGSSLQLLSAPDPAVVPSAGAGGDSYLPVVSRDGRYVLFGSTAGNLIALGTNRPIPGLVPSPLNVFLRDRTNGATVLVSVNLDGTQGGNGDSLPIGISTNGRYVLFESRASDLVPGDTNEASDVFLRDLQAGTTVLASAGTNGVAGDGPSYSSVMTPDGRYVAFTSAADNLVAGDTNAIPDVFVRDMVSNITTVVSVGAEPSPFPFAYSGWPFYLFYRGSDTPVITPDGRYVAFYSTASNLVPEVGPIANVYLRDQKLGTTAWASSGALVALQSVTTATNALSFDFALSDDGRFVVFEAVADSKSSPALILRYDALTGQTDLVDTNAAAPMTVSFEVARNLSLTPDGRFIAYVANAIDSSGFTTAIRVWDAQTGVSTLASGDTNNTVMAGSLSDSPVLDDRGRYVAFVNGVPNPSTNESPTSFHVYLRDLQTQTTTLVDDDTNSADSLIDPSMTPAMSADAKVIAYQRQESAPGPLNGKSAYDVFARDLGHGALELISAHDPNLPSLTPHGASAISSGSSNGRLVAFWSEAEDLVGNDTNGLRDVFVRDALSGTNVLVSVNTNGVSGDGYSTDGAISGDGRYVAFTSSADDLVPGDTNRGSDVFVRDLQAGTTTLVSMNGSGTGPGSGGSYSPLLSTNGQFVLFHSQAGDLVPGVSSSDNLFWRDLQNNRTYALTTNQYADYVSAASMTPDGRLVALAKANSINYPLSPGGKLYVWDSASASIIYSLTGGITAFGPLALSPNGRILAYTTNGLDATQLVAVDLASETNWVIASYQGNPGSAPRFSADSRFLAYAASVGAPASTNQVFLYDFQTGTNLLVSQSYDGVSPGNNHSDSPDLSSDGRFVAYRSAASNLVPGVSNTVPNIYFYDRSSGATTLVTTSRWGGAPADIRSLAPMFTGDGSALIFESWAADLVANDFNQNVDVFSLGLGSTTPATPFAISVSPGTGSVPSNWLSWPVLPGRTYHVQFKQNLNDPAWQDLSGQISIMGERGYLQDQSPVTTQRFYRIVAF